MPICAVVSTHLKKVEGEFAPLSYINLCCAAITSLLLFLAPLLWLVAAYRPEADPAIVHILSDIGWFMFVGGYPPAVLQATAVGVGILGDKSENPIFPRWSGYASLWFAFLFLPAALIPFFS